MKQTEDMLSLGEEKVAYGSAHVAIKAQHLLLMFIIKSGLRAQSLIMTLSLCPVIV